LQELARLRTFLGHECPRLLIKRDDLTGLALGGNKARKLEFLLADARSKGADTVITCGAVRSNHALQTAVACREYGFDVCCVLYGTPPAPNSVYTGNLLLHALLGTSIRWVSMEAGETRREQALHGGIAEEARSVELEGKKPYCIPTGGATAVGALAYVRALQELHSQLGTGENDQVRSLYFASGSGGAHAGPVQRRGHHPVLAHGRRTGVVRRPLTTLTAPRGHFLSFRSKYANSAASAASASLPPNPCPAPCMVTSSASTPAFSSLSTIQTACS